MVGSTGQHAEGNGATNKAAAGRVRAPETAWGSLSAGLSEGRVLCPYCGHEQASAPECERCRGLFEPLSRQATQNAMGPWQVRSEKNPHAPGCSYAKLKEMVAKGRIGRMTVVRGPTTRQFWALACNTPGVAVLMGECHACHTRADPDDYMCRRCGTVLSFTGDRQHLGLAPVALLPWEASAQEVASSGLNLSHARSPSPEPGEVWIEPRREGSMLRISAEPEPAPMGAADRAGRVGQGVWRTMFFVLAGAVLVTGLLAAGVLLTRPAPTPADQAGAAPAPEARVSAEAFFARWAGVLDLVQMLEQEGSVESLRRAIAALEPLVQEADRAGAREAAAALRERTKGLRARLDEIELKRMLAE